MTMPDQPTGFGYKCMWLAVRTDQPEAFIAALELRDVAPSTWEVGVEALYRDRVFITPLIDGWVLAGSTALPFAPDANDVPRTRALVMHLGGRFADVQYFATHRVVEGHGWARVVRGELVRAFAFCEDVTWDEGAPTAEELPLGLSEEGRFPEEEDVLAVARGWSVDPSDLENAELPPSLGWLGSLPR